jgi:hypothetical protein
MGKPSLHHPVVEMGDGCGLSVSVLAASSDLLLSLYLPGLLEENGYIHIRMQHTTRTCWVPISSIIRAT